MIDERRVVTKKSMCGSCVKAITHTPHMPHNILLYLKIGHIMCDKQ